MNIDLSQDELDEPFTQLTHDTSTQYIQLAEQTTRYDILKKKYIQLQKKYDVALHRIAMAETSIQNEQEYTKGEKQRLRGEIDSLQKQISILQQENSKLRIQEQSHLQKLQALPPQKSSSKLVEILRADIQSLQTENSKLLHFTQKLQMDLQERQRAYLELVKIRDEEARERKRVEGMFFNLVCSLQFSGFLSQGPHHKFSFVFQFHFIHSLCSYRTPFSTL